MKRGVQSQNVIPHETQSWIKLRSEFHHEPIETSHFELVDTTMTSSDKPIGCEVATYSAKHIYVESLPSRAIPAYHVEFSISFHAIDGVDSKLLSQYCLRFLRVTATFNQIRDTSRTVTDLRPVLLPRWDGVPGVCVSFAPRWDSADVESSYITISSITLDGEPVSAPPLPATVQVGANHAPSEGTRLLEAVQGRQAAKVYAALCDGCSTGERTTVRSRMYLSRCPSQPRSPACFVEPLPRRRSMARSVAARRFTRQPHTAMTVS